MFDSLWCNYEGTSNADGGAHIESPLDLRLVVLTGQMAKGVHGHGPSGVWLPKLLLDLDGGLSVFNVGLVLDVLR